LPDNKGIFGGVTYWVMNRNTNFSENWCLFQAGEALLCLPITNFVNSVKLLAKNIEFTLSFGIFQQDLSDPRFVLSPVRFAFQYHL
jgi:hypothetical protein